MRSTILKSVAGALCAALAACGGPEFTAGGRDLPVPEEPGLYVIAENDTLKRIDGTDAWERETWSRRSDLRPDVEFIVYQPGLAPARDRPAARLWQVSWVRSEIQPTGAAGPVDGSQWALAEIDAQRQQMVETWHPTIPGLVHLAPEGRLEPGLYEFALAGGTGSRARIGIGWSDVDKNAYASANCVDRLVGETAGYRPCQAGSAAEPRRRQAVETRETRMAARVSSPLRIALEKPVKVDGELRIQGTIVNRSARPQRLPMLQAVIRDAEGRVADTWRFAPPAPSIAPSGDVAFTTFRAAPPNASRLDVDFVTR